MGLGHTFLVDLIELKRSGALDGAKRVVEIGAQQVADNMILSPLLPEVLDAFRASRRYCPSPAGVCNFTHSAPPARPFWEAIGFEHASVDMVGGTIRLDLNRDYVGWRSRRRFDLAVNAGTTEHVANQLNAFTVVHDLMKIGGVMYHEVPAGGMPNHGLISYNPKFFQLLSEANDYKVLFLRRDVHGDDAMIRAALIRTSSARFRCPLDTVP